MSGQLNSVNPAPRFQLSEGPVRRFPRTPVIQARPLLEKPEGRKFTTNPNLAFSYSPSESSRCSSLWRQCSAQSSPDLDMPYTVHLPAWMLVCVARADGRKEPEPQQSGGRLGTWRDVHVWASLRRARGRDKMRFSSLSGSSIVESEAPRHFSTMGIMLVNNATLAELEEFLAGWTTLYSHPHEMRSGVTFLEARPGAGDGQRGFTSTELTPHTDRANATTPPSILATLVMAKDGAGGECLIVDTRVILTDLLRGMPADYCHDLVLEGEVGRSWQVITIVEDRYCQIRYRDDEIARPRARNGTGDHILQVLRSSISSPLSIPLNIGDGYIVHNHRILHGRQAFTGRRRIARILANVRPESDLAWINRGFEINSDAC